MTETIYLNDAYQNLMTATVVAHVDDAVVLDRTIVFPGGGGQPADRGHRTFEGADHHITRLARGDSGSILHGLDLAAVR